MGKYLSKCYLQHLRKVIALAAITFLSLAGLQLAYADDKYDDAVKKAKSYEQNTRSKVADIESQLASAEATAKSFKEKVLMANLTYNNAMSELVIAREKLTVAQKNAREAKSKLQLARKSLGSLARTVYTNQGSLSSISVYLTGDGFETLAMKKVAVDLFGAKANSEIKSYTNLKKVTETIVSRADKAEKNTQKLVETVAAEKSRVVAAQLEANNQVATVNSQKNQLVAELAAARGTTIAAEKARQKQRETERRAKEDAEKRRIQENLNREHTSRNTSVNSNTHPASPNPHNGDLGNQIVAYARNFIGVPYVWGGSTPNGFDCSGLTSYVYRHFGINLPRISQQQRNVGREVSAVEARPGDMVNWYTHVGIYIGNGYMIHAPMPGYTVEISRVWGNPKYIRVS